MIKVVDVLIIFWSVMAIVFGLNEHEKGYGVALAIAGLASLHLWMLMGVWPR